MIVFAYMYLFEYLREILLSKKVFNTYSNQRKKTIFDIDYDSYMDLKMIIFDVDDTLTGFMDKFDKKTKKFLVNLSGRYKVIILTNCLKGREEYIKDFFDDTDVFVKGRADKPMRKSFLFLIENFEIDPTNIMMVGDNPFADM